jgi:hypothetical protein
LHNLNSYLAKCLGLFDKLWRSTEKLWWLMETEPPLLKDLLAEGYKVKDRFEALQKQLEALQRKRRMSAENRQTLDVYNRLFKECGNQMSALHKLVKKPTEQAKEYVLNYRKTGDIEPVRRHVYDLGRTERGQQSG